MAIFIAQRYSRAMPKISQMGFNCAEIARHTAAQPRIQIVPERKNRVKEHLSYIRRNDSNERCLEWRERSDAFHDEKSLGRCPASDKGTSLLYSRN